MQSANSNFLREILIQIPHGGTLKNSKGRMRSFFHVQYRPTLEIFHPRLEKSKNHSHDSRNPSFSAPGLSEQSIRKTLSIRKTYHINIKLYGGPDRSRNLDTIEGKTRLP